MCYVFVLLIESQSTWEGSQKRWKVELTPKSVKIENSSLQFYCKKLEIMHLLKDLSVNRQICCY